MRKKKGRGERGEEEKATAKFFQKKKKITMQFNICDAERADIFCSNACLLPAKKSSPTKAPPRLEFVKKTNNNNIRGAVARGLAMINDENVCIPQRARASGAACEKHPNHTLPTNISLSISCFQTHPTHQV